MIFMDALFTIANFLVFAGFIAYISKTTLIPMVKSMISAHKKAQQDLVDQTIASRAHYRSLQEQLAQQDALYASLDKKVERWQKALDRNQVLLQQLQENQHDSMRLYVTNQQTFLHASHKAHLVMPLVMRETEESLRKHFAHKENRTDYNQKAINHLAGRSS